MIDQALAGVGSSWKKMDDIFFSPDRNNTGPNQILLRDEIFNNGSIRATVTPLGGQPEHCKQKLECGLIGRYRGPQRYITAGIGGHGQKYYISEVTGSSFRLLASKEPDQDKIQEGRDYHIELKFEGKSVFLYVDGQREPLLHGETSILTGGSCGLRVDWTEAKFANVKEENKDKPCLVIAPIGLEGSSTRMRSDYVCERIIYPALADCGYRAQRADEISKSGNIVKQVIDRLFADELIIADLTEYNPNVFYELAIRHATNRPFIQIIQDGVPCPFDLQSIRTIRMTHWTASGIDVAKDALRTMVASIPIQAAQPTQLAARGDSEILGLKELFASQLF